MEGLDYMGTGSQGSGRRENWRWSRPGLRDELDEGAKKGVILKLSVQKGFNKSGSSSVRVESQQGSSWPRGSLF